VVLSRPRVFPTCAARVGALIISQSRHGKDDYHRWKQHCSRSAQLPNALRTSMTLKRKIHGGALAFIGYMLSPLSWWNDMFVNVPLALVFAWVISAFYKPAFGPSLVIGYWLTNVLGFVLIHKGAQTLLSKEEQKYSRRNLFKDLAISLLYTVVIVALVKFGVLKPFQGYFAASDSRSSE
jgi:hypothetical protein